MMFSLILICIITQSAVDAQRPKLTLYSHIWCPPCIKVKALFSKLESTYSDVNFELKECKGKTILYSNKTYRDTTSVDVMPFPTLLFNCGSYNFSYQNDFTFKEISYWIDAICLKKIKFCTTQINQQLFHIAVQPSKKFQNMISTMLDFPHIKICQAKNANYSQDQAIQLLNNVKNKTLFLDYFSQNVRNYLIKSQKLVIALITTNSNSSKAQSFFSTYLALQNYMDRQTQNKSTRIYGYDLSSQQKSQLIFLGLCLNKNTSKCVVNTERKQQVVSSQKYIERLLHFIGLDINHLGDTEYVVAFRFKHPAFESYVYHSMGILDEKFLFWISDILKKEGKKQKAARSCLWSSLVHRITQSSLEDLETHSFLKKQIQALKSKFVNQNITLTRSQKPFHSEPKFTLCLENKMPQTFTTNRDVQDILYLIEDSFRAQMTDEDL